MMSGNGAQRRRLFTGITLTPEIRRFVAGISEQLSTTIADVSWVPPENLHVTLKFLGGCDHDQASAIVEAMHNAAEHLPVRLQVGGVGAFPSQRSARVLWVGATDLEECIVKVYNVLDKGAEKCGFQRENRRYTPHVTIGRSRKKAVRLAPGLEESFTEKLTMKASEIVLFESVLKSTGVEYKIVESVGPPDLRATSEKG